MPLDPTKNFAIVTVVGLHDASATSIPLDAGQGAKLPDPAVDGEYNLSWWNDTDFKNPADDPNVEIVRVTTRLTDTLTVVRGTSGEGTNPASTKNDPGKTYKMLLSPTKKTIDDIETDIAAAGGTKILVDTTDVTINNTLSEVTLLTVPIPANTLGTNNAVKGRLYIRNVRGPGTQATLILRLKYGATTLVTTPAVAPLPNVENQVYIDIFLIASGATGSQEGSILSRFSLTDGINTTNPSLSLFGVGSSAEDSTGALDLVITVQRADPSPFAIVTMSHAVFEVIK